MDVKRFKKLPLLGILRGVELEAIEPLLEEAIIPAGLETIEVTMNTDRADELIKKAARVSGGRLMIGAGTVTDTDSLKAALDAGATFIVMPVLTDDVAGYCVKRRIPFFPGGLTPLEIYKAWKSGATMVKIFPSGFFGPAYFKEIKGPFNDIELLACGGLTPENINDYFLNGASAVAFGASVFKKEWLAAGDFRNIAEYIGKFMRKIKTKK